MGNYKPICEVAEQFNVTREGVRYWIKKYGIANELRKEKGVKRRIYLNVEQLEQALN